MERNWTLSTLLIVSLLHGCTAVVITRLEKELPCIVPHPNTTGRKMVEFVGLMLSTTLIMIISGYVVVVHLLFKELRNLFGKLLLCYSLSVVSVCAIVDTLLLLHYRIVTNSQELCHVTIAFMLAVISIEVFATCLLTHLAYLMYHSYHLKPELPKVRSIRLFRCYMTYEVVTIMLAVLLILLYDIPSDNVLMYVIACIYKAVQMGMFTVYLYYAYKTYNTISDPSTSSKQQKKLFKIAVTMAATVGVSFFIFLSVFIVDVNYLPIIAFVGSVYLLIQQGVIMISFMVTKRMRQLWRHCLAERFRVKL
ncbi:uncharacterized protein [Dysidea avara]|uniref:uncharacterized protein n=1 Tax=Dysidea avara TaxID=196820 RepID=UPI003319114B